MRYNLKLCDFKSILVIEIQIIVQMLLMGDIDPNSSIVCFENITFDKQHVNILCKFFFKKKLFIEI
jgi:hypothetical protein